MEQEKERLRGRERSAVSLGIEGRNDGRMASRVGQSVGRAAFVSISQLRHVKSSRGRTKRN